MIAKHVAMRSIKKSDFGALIRYITQAQNKQERVGLVSVTNCHSDRPDAAILEVINTQAQNKRALSDKTYHLIVSFRAGEEPSEATLKEVERKICDGLGYGEHQRVSAVHYDTDNLHLHIAINKIHPEKHTIHTPYYDHKNLLALCEKIELEYGLEADNHRALKRGGESRAQDMERHAGVESLLGWIKRECLGQLQAARSWQELHGVARTHALEIRLQGNGVVFTDGKTTVKASSIARELSKAKLEARLGAFEPPANSAMMKPVRRYEARPIQTRVDTSGLYAKYRAEQQRSGLERQSQLATALSRRSRAIDAAKQTGRFKRTAIKLLRGGRFSQRALYAFASRSLKDEIQEIIKQYNTERAVISQQYRREAWADWLRRKATEGDSEALTALRAREAAKGLKGNTLAGQGRPAGGTSGARLGTVDSVTKKGTVIYRAGSSAIRDDGVRLAVSRGVSEAGLEMALRMAMQRYGNRLTVTGSDEFKDRIATVAAFKQLPVSFLEPSVESRRQLLARIGSAPSSKVGSSERVDEPKAKGVVRHITNIGKPRGRGR